LSPYNEKNKPWSVDAKLAILILEQSNIQKVDNEWSGQLKKIIENKGFSFIHFSDSTHMGFF